MCHLLVSPRSVFSRPHLRPLPQGPLAPPKSNAHVVLAAAVSSDGSLLATGGNDKLVHVWDVRAGKHVQGFSGHRGAVHGLSFREGTKTLFSASDDRCVKIWSLEDMSYVDTLFGASERLPAHLKRERWGLPDVSSRDEAAYAVLSSPHQLWRGWAGLIDHARLERGLRALASAGHENGVLGLAGCKRERVVSVSSDRTCRLWKVRGARLQVCLALPYCLSSGSASAGETVTVPTLGARSTI